MAGKCKLDLNKREKALLRKIKAGMPDPSGRWPVALDNLFDRGLLRWRATDLKWVLSQKGQRWLAALEREEG